LEKVTALGGKKIKVTALEEKKLGAFYFFLSVCSALLHNHRSALYLFKKQKSRIKVLASTNRT